jgi:hypothetical protein
MMAEPTQEELLTYIGTAITFYEGVTGQLPTDKQIQALLATCGVHVALERISTNVDIIRELEQEDAPPADQPFFS